jgi:hypothetical protein
MPAATGTPGSRAAKRRAVALVVIAALAAACRGDAPAEAAGPPPLVPFDTRLVGEPAPADDLAGGTVVELLKPGAEPRRALRYRVPAGAEQRVRSVQRFTMQMEIDGNPFISPPPMTGESEFLLRRGTDPDDYRIEIVAASVPDFSLGFGGPPTTEKLDLTGRSFSIAVTDRGIVTTPLADVDLDATTIQGSATVLQALAYISASLGAPLPEEPVGVGAEWRATQETFAAAGGSGQSSVFKLVALDGDRIELAQRVEGLDLSATSFGDPRLEYENAEASGGSRLVLGLDRLAPRSASGKVRHLVILRMIGKDGVQRVASGSVVETEQSAR